MAKYDIAYSCGHRVTKDLWGKTKDREGYIEWAARYGQCQACREADREKVDADFDAAHEMAPLTGSEKQIDWAQSIRRAKIKEIMSCLDGIRRRAEERGELEEYERRTAVVLQTLQQETSAGWWIDRRDNIGETIINEVWRAVRPRKSAT